MAVDANGHVLRVGDVVNVPVKITKFIGSAEVMEGTSLYGDNPPLYFHLDTDRVVFAAPDYPRDELAHDKKPEYCGE